MKNTRRCKVCRERFEPKWSNQVVCLNDSCVLEFHKLNREKNIEKLKKAERKESRSVIEAMKEKNKTHSDYQKELQPLINKITALIDKETNCICCNKPITDLNRSNAGHRFAVGGNNSLRFNLHNIHQNGVCCNKWKNGNPDGYDDGLIRVYGKEYFEYVKWQLKGLYTEVKLTKDELIECKFKALKIVGRLKKLDATYSPDERLKLRDEINDEIGIYQNFFTFDPNK